MFKHSIKVPQLYSAAAKITENVSSSGASVKNLVYQKKFLNTKALFALVVTTLKHNNHLEFLFKRTKLLEKEPRLNPWLARVLIAELLWGKKRLSSESKPIKTILAYQQVLSAHATDVYEDQPVNSKVTKPRFVRVNTLLTTVKDVINGFRDEGWTFVRYMDTKNYDGFLEKVTNLADNEFMTDIHIPELLVFPSNTQFYSHNAYRNGLIILQDKASCLPVHLLNPTPGSIVLDMCAAPGMKTSQLAAKLKNHGKVFAVDLNTSRLKTLENLMESTGVTCVKAVNEDVLKLTNKECPEVEYILVDPSCSGSGIVDRLDLTNHAVKDNERIRKLQGFQIMILKHALRRFPKAKRVIYSTCSTYPEENEEVIKEVLPQISKFKLVSASNLLKTPWYNFGSKEYGDIGNFSLYSKNETDLTNGFFVAVFERLNEGEKNEYFVENNITKKYANGEALKNISKSKNSNEDVSTTNELKKKKQKNKDKDRINKTVDEEREHTLYQKSCDQKVTYDTEGDKKIQNREETSLKRKRKRSNMKNEIIQENFSEEYNELNKVELEENYDDGKLPEHDETNSKVKYKKKTHKKKFQRNEYNTADDIIAETQATVNARDIYVLPIAKNKEKNKKKKHRKERLSALHSNENNDSIIELSCSSILKTSQEFNTETYKKKQKKHKKQKLELSNDIRSPHESTNLNNSELQNSNKSKCKNNDSGSDVNRLKDAVERITEESLVIDVPLTNNKKKSKLIEKDDESPKKQRKKKHNEEISPLVNVKYNPENALNYINSEQIYTEEEIPYIKKNKHKKEKEYTEKTNTSTQNNDRSIIYELTEGRTKEKTTRKSNCNIEINSEEQSQKCILEELLNAYIANNSEMSP